MDNAINLSYSIVKICQLWRADSNISHVGCSLHLLCVGSVASPMNGGFSWEIVKCCRCSVVMGFL